MYQILKRKEKTYLLRINVTIILLFSHNLYGNNKKKLVLNCGNNKN